MVVLVEIKKASRLLFVALLVLCAASAPSCYAFSSTNPSENGSAQPPPDLVDKQAFVQAYELVTQGKVTTLPSQTKMYAIGKLKVPCKIMPTPGFDLSESTSGGLVLVSQVTGNAQEAGLMIGDTITGVSVTTTTSGTTLFQASTKELTLEETGTLLMQSAEQALRNNMNEIELDLNRLIKLAYAE